jgi:hypothetical protein
MSVQEIYSRGKLRVSARENRKKLPIPTAERRLQNQARDEDVEKRSSPLSSRQFVTPRHSYQSESGAPYLLGSRSVFSHGEAVRYSQFSMATRNSKEHGISLEEQAQSLDEDGELYVTIMATRKPNPRGPGYIKLYALVAVMLLCSTMNGFDSSLMGSINTLPNYTTYFGLPASGNASTGIVFAIFQVNHAQVHWER